MGQNESQPSLEELAEIAKAAAIRAKDDSLSSAAKQQALLEKKLALTELISALMERIKIEFPKPQNIDLSRNVYEQSLQELWLYICKNIDRYERKKGSVIAWVIFIFKNRKIDAFKWIIWHGRVISIYQDENDSGRTLIDDYVPPDVNPSPLDTVIEFLKEDPEGLFAKTLFKNNPKASFQAIALKRCEEEKSWAEIVNELELGNTVGPVSTFYQRCCKKFIPYFQKFLGE